MNNSDITEDTELIVPVNKVKVSTQYESSKQGASTQCENNFKAALSVETVLKQMLAPSVKEPAHKLHSCQLLN